MSPLPPWAQILAFAAAAVAVGALAFVMAARCP